MRNFNRDFQNRRIDSLAGGYLNGMAVMPPEEKAIEIPHYEIGRISVIIGFVQHVLRQDTASINILEASIELPDRPAENHMVARRLNDALRRTQTWQSFSGKKVLAYIREHAENGQRAVPMRSIEKNIGFSVSACRGNGGSAARLLLRLPDEVHQRAPMDMDQAIREIKDQLAPDGRDLSPGRG